MIWDCEAKKSGARGAEANWIESPESAVGAGNALADIRLGIAKVPNRLAMPPGDTGAVKLAALTIPPAVIDGGVWGMVRRNKVPESFAPP